MMASPEACPALVLNADFRPLSCFPLSLWPWQEAVKAVFLDRVNILSEYDEMVHSPSLAMRLPSVISLKEYVPQERRPRMLRGCRTWPPESSNSWSHPRRYPGDR